MTLYTAIGRYELRESSAGEKRPHIHVGDNEFELDVWEMIIWSSLIWNIYTFTEINREFYMKEREAHILGERSCEEYLDRMERKGLVACGHGVTGEDALRDLVMHLHVIPTTANFITKAGAFLHLTFVKGIPLKITRRIFDRPKFTDIEKLLMTTIKRELLTTDELVSGFGGVDSEGNRIEKRKVISELANLYLNKHILFDVIE